MKLLPIGSKILNKETRILFDDTLKTTQGR